MQQPEALLIYIIQRVMEDELLKILFVLYGFLYTNMVLFEIWLEKYVSLFPKSLLNY